MTILEKNNCSFLSNYFMMLLVSILLWLEVYLFQTSFLVPYALMIIGIINIVSIYKNYKLLLTPVGLFSLIWLVIIPFCSFEYPLMRAMSVFEWNKVLLLIIFFSLGGLMSSFCKKKKSKKIQHLSNNTLIINLLVLIISLVSLIALYVNYGGVPLFAQDANVAKTLFRSIPFLSFLSYFGNISILIFIINDDRIIKNKLFLLLSIIYVFLLILSAERFFVTLLILSIAFVYCKQYIDIKLLKKFMLLVILVFSIFMFVLCYRGNEEQKDLYFIQSGIYNGNAKTLVNTEILRYFGMQERVITNTYLYIDPGYTKGSLTFSPFLKIIGKNSVEIPDVQIYGYTSKSIITKTYADFGHFWGIAIIIFSFIINTSYYKFSRENSLLSQYMNSVWLIFLLFSFYAYIDNLIILFLYFPLYVWLIEIINNNNKKEEII